MARSARVMRGSVLRSEAGDPISWLRREPMMIACSCVSLIPLGSFAIAAAGALGAGSGSGGRGVAAAAAWALYRAWAAALRRTGVLTVEPCCAPYVCVQVAVLNEAPSLPSGWAARAFPPLSPRTGRCLAEAAAELLDHGSFPMRGSGSCCVMKWRACCCEKFAPLEDAALNRVVSGP